MKIGSYLSSTIAIASVGLFAGKTLSVSGETEFPSVAPTPTLSPTTPSPSNWPSVAPTPTLSPTTPSPSNFDECPCRYLKYEFRLNYNLTCDDTTFGGETYCEMPDYRPSGPHPSYVMAESFLIVEFDEDGNQLAETELMDRNPWRYWRIEAHELTRKFRITVRPGDEGEEANESIVEFYVFESNTCQQEDSLPTFQENDTIGWVVIKEVTTPYRDYYSRRQCMASASPSNSPSVAYSNFPSDVPSVAPSQSPTWSPTTASPSNLPSVAHSNLPSDVPSVAPSPSPTVCKDDKKYRYRQNKKKDCNWVGRQLKKKGKENMCEDIPFIRNACPLTCGICCADSTEFFYKKKTKDCNWVRRQVEKKGNNKICDKEYEGIIVKDACRVACGVCSN